MTEYGDIYLMRSKGDNIPYVGITTLGKYRHRKHIEAIKRGKHHSWKLNKYCKENNKSDNDFYFSTIEKSIPISCLQEKEKYWIKYYDSYNNGFNASLGGEKFAISGGENNFHAKLTDKIVKEIISEYLLGKLTTKQLSEKYNTSQSSVVTLTTGRAWKHITGKYKEQMKLVAKKHRSNATSINGCIQGKKNNIPCEWNGKKYNSITAAAIENNVTISAMCSRLKKNLKSDNDIPKRSSWKNKKVLIDNIVFDSVASAAENYNVTRCSIKYWSKIGKAKYL